MRLLELGTQGEDVRQVQKDLNLHFDEPSFQQALKNQLKKDNRYPAGMKPLNPDGKFGVLTRAAVIALQTDKALSKIDGIVGPETMAALYPYAVHAARISVTPGASKAPSNLIIPPVSAPAALTTISSFPGIHFPLPAPLLPPLTLPGVPPATPAQSALAQLKAGVQHNIPLGTSSAAYDTLNLDFIAIIPTPSRVTQGLDFGWALPISDGAKSTATVWWSVAWWPSFFKYKRFDLLGLSAKAGVGVTTKKGSSALDPDANANLAISARWNAVDVGDATLSVFVQGADSSTLTLDGSSVKASTTLGGTIGVTWTLKK